MVPPVKNTKNLKSATKSPPKKENFAYKLRKCLKEYTQTTSIQGLRYVSEEKSIFAKILWVIIILVSLAACFYMIDCILYRFTHYPIVVSFAAEDTSIQEVPFPSVTICLEPKCYSSENFNYTYVTSMISNSKGSKLTKEENYTFSNLALLCNEVDSDFITLEHGNSTVGDDFFQIARKFKPPHFNFIKCRYLGVDQNCSEFFSPVILDQGICYSYNSLSKSELFKQNVVIPDKMFYTTSNNKIFFGEYGYIEGAGTVTYPGRALTSGASNALEISLTYDRNGSDMSCTKNLDGFRVLLQSPLDMPLLSNDYFRFSNFKAVSVAVEPRFVVTSDRVRKYGAEKRQCYFRTEKALTFFKFYTQSNCNLECETHYTLKSCGCVSFYMPRNNKTKICGIAKAACLKQSKFMLNFADMFNISDKTHFNKSDCDCKPSCTELEYKTTISHSNYESNRGIKLDCTENGCPTARLSIYFKNDKFTTIERNEMYGMSDLISNVGGLLGLFMGFSIMSVVEFLYFFTLKPIFNKIYNSN